MVDGRFPWPRTEPVSHRSMLEEFFGTDENFTKAARVAWPALKALSNIGPDVIPDLTKVLPPPDDKAYPEQAIGLHVLIDQAPRVLFHGIDARWVSYFDKVVEELFDTQSKLPKKLQPWQPERWSDASFEYWVIVHSTWNSALTHRESVAKQQEALQMGEDNRVAIEKWSGKKDPARGDDSIRKDIYAFPKLVTVIDFHDFDTFEDVGFFMCKVTDVHKPVIDHFGRYPYRNAIEGRNSTDEEKIWIEKVDHFAEAPPDVAKRVREDIDAGKWTALGEGGSSFMTGLHINIHTS
ncbi:hypothetical protein UCRPA7_626 [Phaeoacremonium minimum UCRPA7]|uniref:Uncharacterized protein n=1 Tax=Phaeoacremonium minimum (strain UCR-PA7) TaxID=1286976 RepID=R8BWW9_PHAM7|nr:hypothetical protein UCRPA7_626 [Phaeoacremonium minimum UCRPA7]EOO03861.1 hypothetical protein UCRPA7_626 [Phaeoacremonium minimum UCRPA7]